MNLLSGIDFSGLGDDTRATLLPPGGDPLDLVRSAEQEYLDSTKSDSLDPKSWDSQAAMSLPSYPLTSAPAKSGGLDIGGAWKSLVNAVSPSPTPAPAQRPYTPAAAVAVSTTPSADSVPVRPATVGAATAVAKAIAPNLSPAQAQQAGQQIFTLAKQGRRIYAPKAKAHSSAAPWLIGIGAVVVLALGLVMTRE